MEPVEEPSLQQVLGFERAWCQVEPVEGLWLEQHRLEPVKGFSQEQEQYF